MPVRYLTRVKWHALKESYLLILTKHYFFRKVLGLQKKWAESLEIPIYALPPPHTHTHTSSPTINIPHQSGTLVTIDESTLTHHYHPDPGVCIRVHAWCCMFHAIWHTYNNMYPPLSYDTEEFHPHKNPLYSDLFIPFVPGYFIFIWLRKKKNSHTSFHVA